MAAIEKVCEFSGEYGSYDMYSYKLNQLQIMPKYRKNFRGANHTLHIFKPVKMLVNKSGCSSYYDPRWMENYLPPFESEKEYMQYVKDVEGKRFINKYDFMLQVYDKNLKGKVDGYYLNSTKDLKTMKRKMKRLLRLNSLNIVFHEISHSEYVKEGE